MITDKIVAEYRKEYEKYKYAHNGFEHYLISLIENERFNNKPLPAITLNMKEAIEFIPPSPNLNEINSIIDIEKNKMERLGLL
ncbi:MAG: hypothetical protein ACTSU6_04835 [Candidatus Njordarchaeales archaeon]